MKTLTGLARTVLGLCFDDGSLALAILAQLTWTLLLARLGVLGSASAAVVLVAGTLALLVENVLRAAWRP